MANFKAALEALAVGKLNHKSLSKQLDGVLNSSPKFANKMLSELDEVYGQKKLNDKQYSVLKDQIIKFRQAHTSKTNKQPQKRVQRQKFALGESGEPAKASRRPTFSIL